MDLEAIAGRPPEVDHEAIDTEVMAYVNREVPAVKERWKITTLGQARWCLQRVAEVRAAAAEYDAEIEVLARARDRLLRAVEWHEDRLKDWAIENRTEARKSFDLGYGTVSTRPTKEAVVVADSALALEWAKRACPAAVKTEESFLVSKVSGVSIATVVKQYRVINPETGETHTIDLIDPEVLDEDSMQGLADCFGGPPFRVEATETYRAVVDEGGVVVPGLGVRAGKITATVGAVLA